MIKAVLFDMDGVLVDSEELICKAAIRMFAESGLEVKPEDFLPFVGAGENRYIGGVAEKHGFNIDITDSKRRTYEIYEDIAKQELTPLPGVKEFISRCRKKGLKLAVATSADRVKMLVNFKCMKMTENDFDGTVNGLQVERKKPFPDIYLEAAKKLAVLPSECLVVEDAINGIEAAKAAGARCLALTTSFPEAKLFLADWICSFLSDAPEEAIDW
jgi:beta-phosphoglucomutase